MVVPTGQPASASSPAHSPASVYRVPISSVAARVSISVSLTAQMEASASPRKPSVPMRSRSSGRSTLLVACRRNAFGTSSRSMPQPLSVTRMSRTPPCPISTVMAVAPASIEFSTSSFTTEAGRSITSPAAISSAVSRSSILIFGTGSSPFTVLAMVSLVYIAVYNSFFSS